VTIPDHFKLDVRPLANPESIVTVTQARFTVLTSRF